MPITTEAWVLYKGENSKNGESQKGELIRESLSFSGISEDEVLIEPIYGSWEGNMGHALDRRPVDICRQRNEERVVLCNAGVARVLKTGAMVRGLAEGDTCMVTGNSVWDKRGYMIKAFAYDAPNTVGLLARQTKVHPQQLIRIPENTKYSLRQWAAFSIRYVTAWANWKQAYGSLRVQLSEQEYPNPFVWGWGGGVALAELELANLFGCRTAMLASNGDRLRMIAESGIEPIDRRQFGSLSFDQDKYDRDPQFSQAYKASEDAFLAVVKEKTGGSYVSIFIDNIGTPVIRATLKSLACPGVITTAGWKCGMSINLVRAIECMKWHTHVHTHYSRYSDTLEAVRFAEQNEWMPRLDGEVYSYDNVPLLARDFSEGKTSDYFPLFEVNTL
jgi:NADPH:quinone reductase-like Zn-dependent oxidoreductase